MTYIVEVYNEWWGIEIDSYGIYEEASYFSSWILGADLGDYLGI